MTTSAGDAKNLIVLAERMGIPAGEALRQVAQLMSDDVPNVAEPSPAPAPSPQATIAVV